MSDKEQRVRELSEILVPHQVRLEKLDMLFRRKNVLEIEIAAIDECIYEELHILFDRMVVDVITAAGKGRPL